MQVGHHVAQAGEVDLVRIEQAAQAALGRQHRVQQCMGFGGGEFAHLGDVAVEHHAAEAGEVVGVGDAHHAAEFVAPEQFAARRRAEFTVGFPPHGQSITAIGAAVTSASGPEPAAP